MKLEIIKMSGSQLSVDIGTMWATCYHRERYAVLYNVQEPHQLLTMRGNNCISSLRHWYSVGYLLSQKKIKSMYKNHISFHNDRSLTIYSQTCQCGHLY